MSSILVTGATGFVGGAFVETLCSAGHTVCASGRADRPSSLPETVGYVKADLAHVFPTLDTEVVIHAAALASDTADESDLQEINVGGTQRVFAATTSSRVFVYISSSSVYPYTHSLHSEEEPVMLNDLSPYGRSKRMAEEWLLQQDWSERRLVILRPRAIYGVGDRVLLPRLMRLVRGSWLMLPGQAPVLSSLTHIQNLTEAAVRLINGPSGVHVFNIADASPYPLQEVLPVLLQTVCGRSLKTVSISPSFLYGLARLSKFLNLGHSLTRFGLDALAKNHVLDCNKLGHTLGQLPERDLWQALPELAEWVRGDAKTGLGADNF
ncbi:MAG: NAD(P)-dependent oxidoreductase [Saprospiraceae bacterium]|nr:NAD(P)-dependent oxidoreductase [Saprospiraceae bacterium]